MNTKQKTNQKGFTIIEVMIVLAIAGLILAIVLFAVPALQRNGRNAQIRTTANTLLGYFSEYPSNNNGKTPACVNVASDGTVTLGATGTGYSTTTCSGGTNVGKIQGGYALANLPSTAADAADGTLYIGLKMTCVSAGTKISGTTSARGLSVGYANEINGGNGAAQCVGS